MGRAFDGRAGLFADWPGSALAGVADEDLEQLLTRVQRRDYPTGTVVIAQGEKPPGVYLIQQGAAGVYLSDQYGREHLLDRIEPGSTFGEMSLLTGDPATATVRALEDLETLLLTRADFERLAARSPVIYRNIGAILSERLAETAQIAAGKPLGRVTVLRDWGAPPRLAYAVAASVAWHTRTRAVVLAAGDVPDELRGLATGEERWETHEPGVDVIVEGADAPISWHVLEDRAEALSYRYDHVLVFVRGDGPAIGQRLVDLAPDRSSIPSGVAGADVSVVVTPGAEARAPHPVGGILEVPPLDAADDEALAAGLLPPETAAARALGWVARDLAGLKVGLALGAGSLRGYAHFGVQQVLERVGIRPDYLAGTSVGSAVAAMIALGYSATEGAATLTKGSRSVFRPAFPVYSLLAGGGVRRFVQAIAGSRRIEDLEIPLAVIAADLESGREVVLRRGLLWQAVVASMAIPGAYPAQRVGSWTLVDGGIVDPVPTTVCATMGADIVIGVDLARRPVEQVAEAEAVASHMRPPAVLGVLMRSIDIMQSHVTGSASQATTIIVNPDLPKVEGALRNFAAGQSFVQQGQKAAEEALPRLTAALPWLRDHAPVAAAPAAPA